ncbi:MAG: hypothetical protein HYZ84_02425 [Candidatus Omnitrophica bacterium]|nr:hypothetical protein [Candidatus Omnitrophota bacterium]
MKSLRSNRGTTFVELIIAGVIVSFLAGVIYVTFLQGNRVWRYAVANSPDSDADYLVEKLAGDLRNAFAYVPNVLVGAPESLQFYTRVPDRPNAASSRETVMQQPVRVRYHFDGNLKSVIKTQESYQKILFPGTSGENKTTLIAGQIKDMDIHYYAPRNKSTSIQWESYWNRACLPKAVKLDIEFDKKKTNKTITRIIPIPAGGCTE